MSYGQNEIRTFFRVHDYKFSWTIDHFSEMPDSLEGPAFTPIPGCSKKYCFGLNYAKTTSQCSLDVLLKDLDIDNEPLYISTSTSLSNAADIVSFVQEWPREKRVSNTFNLLHVGILRVLEKDELSKKLRLIEDKLVVKGTLSFSGYDVISSISSPRIKMEPGACGELSKDLKSLFQNGASSDVTFSVGEKTLRAHRNVICCRSPVFATMFNNEMPERNTNNVIIENTDLHAFNCFLMYLYTGLVEDIQETTVLALYSLAHKYEVDSLLKICSELLGSSLEISSVCKILIFSDVHGDKKLKDLACNFIREHLAQVVTSTKWSEMVASKSHLPREVLAPFISETNLK